jgi:hypothetical protein
MKKFYFAIVLFLHSFVFVYSQHSIKDAISLESVPFVEIYSDTGNLIGSTDVDGLLSKDLENKILLANAKRLTFVNSFYQNQVVAIDDFNSNTVFKMNPIVNALKEVVVSNKKDKNEYLVLKTYVRSLQINNDRVHYFMDGIVEYYISLKTKKVKLKFLSNRSFENKSIPQLKEKGFKVYFQIVGAPMLSELLDYTKLSENYGLQKSTADVKIKNKEDNSLKGNLYLNPNGTSLTLGIITDDKPKVMKGLGVENILNNYTINSLFSNKEFEDIGFDSLLYFKETRNYEIKAKKDKVTQKVDATHEVFVLGYRFSEKIDAKGLDSNYSLVHSSTYQDNYWEHVNNALFQPLPIALEKYIEENLTEIKKQE